MILADQSTILDDAHALTRDTQRTMTQLSLITVAQALGTPYHQLAGPDALTPDELERLARVLGGLAQAVEQELQRSRGTVQ